MRTKEVYEVQLSFKRDRFKDQSLDRRCSLCLIYFHTSYGREQFFNKNCLFKI